MMDLVQKLLDAWYPLWNLVFQPAIGVLMLGAVSVLLLLPVMTSVGSAAIPYRLLYVWLNL